MEQCIACYPRIEGKAPSSFRRKKVVIMAPLDPIAEVGLLGIRKEIQDFVRAAETLLSHSLTSHLTLAECNLVRDYVRVMSDAKNPWIRELPIKYN